ncbi:DUF1120 domain-containing protein [Pseudomonas sp. LB3P31]
MKKYIAALSATALIGIAPYTMAGSSTDLTVKGLITPAACLPTLSGGGIIDHGKLASRDLNQTKPTRLPTQSMQFSVNCDSATVFTLKSTDNRMGSDYDEGALFGLGKINGDQKLGGFQGRFANLNADGVPVRSLVSYNNGGNWSTRPTWTPEGIYAFGSLTGTPLPIAIKDLVSDMGVETFIARADSLDLSSEVALDGSATLEIVY